jgi:hypothetical protein
LGEFHFFKPSINTNDSHKAIHEYWSEWIRIIVLHKCHANEIKRWQQLKTASSCCYSQPWMVNECH